MTFLAVDECRAWAERHGHMVAGTPGTPIVALGESWWDFRLPQSSGVQAALAHALWAGVTDEHRDEVLVWLTDWGMGGAAEHMPLMEATRRGLGADRPLIETPGYRVNGEATDAGLCILMLAMFFSWEAWLLPAGNRPAVMVGSNELGIMTRRGDGTGLRERIASFALPISESRRAAV